MPNRSRRPSKGSPKKNGGNSKQGPFRLSVDLSHFGSFQPNEVSVQVIDGCVEITGKQEWRPHPGGAVRREFAQRHILPLDCDADNISATLAKNGMLVVEAPHAVDIAAKLRKLAGQTADAQQIRFV